MADFLDVLAWGARETISKGYYKVLTSHMATHVNLKEAIIESKTVPIIAEIKQASPSAGTIRKDLEVEQVAKAIEKGGAVGLSVLTEPKHFKGSLNSLAEARKAVKLPILMKDIILSPAQLEAASRIGANAVLLIQALFDRGYCEYNIDEMIVKAHSKNLEVLLEAHNKDEFCSAVESDADLIGINNRDLGTLKVDLNVTRRILKNNDARGKIVVSESGINTPADVRFLRECGAHAFLIGSAVMRSSNVEAKVKEFVHSL